jgi:predicted metal-dependent hydrolase
MDERLRTGIRLFNKREFFECHEVLEAAWMAEAGPRRLFLQALIHLAVGFYHCQRHNPAGATRQLQKGLHKLTAYLPCCEGIDTARLHREALAARERIEAGAPLSAYPQIHLQGSSGAGSSRPLLVTGV